MFNHNQKWWARKTQAAEDMLLDAQNNKKVKTCFKEQAPVMGKPIRVKIGSKIIGERTNFKLKTVATTPKGKEIAKSYNGHAFDSHKEFVKLCDIARHEGEKHFYIKQYEMQRRRWVEFRTYEVEASRAINYRLLPV